MKDPKPILKILNSDSLIDKKALFVFDSQEDSIEAIVLKYNLWSRYFFPQYFESEDAPFHNEINTNNVKIYKGEIDQFIDSAFRGAGKDVKTKLFIPFCILNDRKHFRKYFKVLSADLTNSKQTVTDIYNMLINPRVMEMYPDTFEKTIYKREETMSSFTTSTGIKVLADSIGTEQRGAIQEESRPDFIWFNDFETRKTLRSAVISKAIWDNMEEARTGLQKGGGCIYTCNYVSEVGNVHRLITEKNNPRKVILNVPISLNHSVTPIVPTWKRYSVQDIEQMIKSDDDFWGERMNKPDASKDIYFERSAIEIMPVREPIEVYSGFKMFRKYNPSHRYAGGMDVAGGVGLDSSTSVFIDFSFFPAQVVGTFASNTILPEAFGDEIVSQANRFGGCLIAPENNRFEQAILKAKMLNAKLYTGIGRIIKIHAVAPSTFGWNTNSLSKSTMLSSLRDAIENGLIQLNDKDLIAEAKAFTRNDLIDNPPDIRLTTRHFDLLIACAIAWQMKNHTRPAKPLLDVEEFLNKEVNEAI